MKRAILILCALLMTSVLSARIRLQLDTFGLSNQFEYDYNCFSEKPEMFDYYFHPIDGALISLGYEFFTDRTDKDFHFFGGVNFGVLEGYLNLGGFAGFNYKLFETEKFRYELETTLGYGHIAAIKGPEYDYFQTTVDFVWNLKSRRFPYAGVGLSNVNTTDINYFQDFGYKNHLLDTFSLHLVAGLRL